MDAEEHATPIETEFKFLVEDERAFDALAAHVGLELGAPLTQNNHFFDTAEGLLRRARYALRLRLEPGRARLTAKGPAQQGAGETDLAVRPEEEIELDAEVANAILRGGLSPLEAFEERGGDSRLLLSIRGLVGERALLPIGSFLNHRRLLGPVPLACGSGEIPAIFELDRTEFSGGRVDCEIEVEVEHDASPACREALHALLADAGVAWRPSRSKVERMFEAAGGAEELAR
jgi:uncharacterized protein YjbK